MKLTIWKYPVRPGIPFAIPIGARILCVQMQNDSPCLWAVVDPRAAKEAREVVIYGTGHDFDPLTTGDYLGTFQMDGGALVFHAFEKRPVAEEGGERG